MRLRSSKRAQPPPEEPPQSSAPASPRRRRPIAANDTTYPTSLSPTQINRLRLKGTFPTTPALPNAIAYLCHHLLSVQAQDADATLLQLWNRLPPPRPSRSELAALALHGPEAAGVARIWAQRCTLQLVTEADWSMLSACVKSRIRAMRESSTGQHKVTDKLHELERRVEKSLQDGDRVSTKEIDEWISQLGVTGDARLSLKYSLPVLACVDGKAQRILGKDVRRVCISKREVDWKVWKEEDALAHAAVRYFTTYGPALESDFRYWMYITADASKRAVERVVTEGSVVAIGHMLIGKTRITELDQEMDTRVVLLGRFDAAILAHKDKSWIIEERLRRRIWSTHSEVSACVVVDGRICGKWRHSKGVIFIELFDVQIDAGAVAEMKERAQELVDDFYQSDGKIVIQRETGNEGSHKRRKR